MLTVVDNIYFWPCIAMPKANRALGLIHHCIVATDEFWMFYGLTQTHGQDAADKGHF